MKPSTYMLIALSTPALYLMIKLNNIEYIMFLAVVVSAIWLGFFYGTEDIVPLMNKCIRQAEKVKLLLLNTQHGEKFRKRRKKK